MIEDSPILTMKKKIIRPSQSQLNAFKKFQTGHIVDALSGRGALSGDIKAISKKYSNFVGSALTCLCGPADNLAAIAAIGVAEEGDVIVAATDKFKGTAVMGDLMLGIAKNRGVKAFVTDGYVRDIEGINKHFFPCFASGTIPNSPARNGPGTIGMSIVCGEVNISSGDIIVGDIDGIVVVPHKIINDVIDKLEEVIKLEKEAEKKVNKGAKSTELIDKIFKNGSIKIID
tara:strand:- start:7404 stop:8093 length:690 start_codon:yes stop_codon:yes gene_type:complete